MCFSVLLWNLTQVNESINAPGHSWNGSFRYHVWVPISVQFYNRLFYPTRLKNRNFMQWWMKIKVKILSVYFFLDAAKMSRLFFQTSFQISFIVFFFFNGSFQKNLIFVRIFMVCDNWCNMIEIILIWKFETLKVNLHCQRFYQQRMRRLF